MFSKWILDLKGVSIYFDITGPQFYKKKKIWILPKGEDTLGSKYGYPQDLHKINTQQNTLITRHGSTQFFEKLIIQNITNLSWPHVCNPIGRKKITIIQHQQFFFIHYIYQCEYIEWFWKISANRHSCWLYRFSVMYRLLRWTPTLVEDSMVKIRRRNIQGRSYWNKRTWQRK